MKKKVTAIRVMALTFVLFFVATFAQAATITSTATGGTWATGSTWVGGVAPVAADLVIIATTGGNLVTVGTSTTCASLTVNAAASISLGTRTLTVSGLVNNAGTISISTGQIAQSGTGNLTNSGTITYTGAGRLYLTGSMTNTGTMTLASALVYFTGANAGASTSSGFTTTGLVTFQRTAGSVTLSGNLSGGGLTINGTGGTLNLGTALSHTFTGAITITTGTLNGGSSLLLTNLLGTAWSYNAGTFTAGTGTVNLGGAGAQTLTGTLTATFNNLTLSGSGLKTLTRVPVVNGILSMEGTATSSIAPTYGAASTIQYKGTGARTIGVEFPTAFAGSGGVIIDQGVGNTVTLNEIKTALSGNLNILSGNLDLSTFTANRASAGGTLTVAASATLKIGGTNTLPSNYSAHSIATSSTVEYAGAAQTVANLNSAQSYGNLTLSGSGTKTLQIGTTAIATNLTTSGTAAVTGVIGLSIGGNVNIQSGSSFTAGAFTHTIGGNWTNNGTFVNTGSTLNFNGANAATIGVGSFNNLTFSGAGVKTAIGALTVSGNLLVSNNFSAGSFSHSIAGDWTNNGSFTAGTSTFTFTNASAKNLNGTNTTTFNNLTLNGAGGVSLGIGSTVAGTLTLTSGHITLGTNTLTVASLSGGSSGSYVKTSVSGVLKRSLTQNIAVNFPVGLSAYNPITLTNTTGGNVDNYSVRVLDGALSNANSTKTVDRKWQITEEVAGGSALTVAATYNTADGFGVGFNAAVSPVFGYFNGLSWPKAISATLSGSNPYTFTSGVGAIASPDMTSTSGFLSVGSGDAFSASKLAIKSISPATPYSGQANVTITVQSQNSSSVPTDVLSTTDVGLTSANSVLSGSVTGTILANANEKTFSGLALTGTTGSATITATKGASGDALIAGTSALFTVALGNIYRPAATGNWNSVQWQISTDGGSNYSNTTVPTNSIFGTLDVILVPTGITLTANVTSASFYNMQVVGTLIISTGTYTLFHSGPGDYGLQVFGTLQHTGGTLTNDNTNFSPIIFQGGTYIHALNGGSIPVSNWNTYISTPSTCQITGITSTALTAGLDQSFQNFTWNNASQAVTQTLTANLSVSGALTLTNGVITTSTNRVIIGASGTATSANNSRIHGNLRRFVPNVAAPTVAFPIGDDTKYTPISVTFVGATTGSGYLDASTATAQPPLASALSQTQYINRSWTLTNTGIAGFTSYSPTFTFVVGDKIGSPTFSSLVIRKLSGTTWASTTTGSQTEFSTQCTNQTAFSTFAIGEDNSSATNAIWFGGTSTDWNTTSNWSNNSVPTSAIDVEIPTGPANQPVMSGAAICKNLTIDASATLTISGANTLSVYGNWVKNGTFTPGTGTVAMVGASAQTITGATTFTNLTVNNATGVTSASNITVNGALDLQSANASTTKGALDMGILTLNMGVASTTTGFGDVTGTITRTHSFAFNTFYTYGHANTGVSFADVLNQTLPTSLSVKLSIGTAPDWSGSSGDVIQTPLKRVFEAVQTAGAGTSATIKVHYLDNEYTALNESKFTMWNRIHTGIYTVNELGKSDQDISANFVSIQNIDVYSISAAWGDFALTIAPSQATILTWTGATNSDWNTSTNWTPVSIPSVDYAVLIPNATTTVNDPLIPNGTNTCVSVLIESGGILNAAASSNLILTGTGAVWTKESSGVFNCSTGTVTVSSTVDFATLVGNTDFYNLTVSDVSQLRPTASSITGITGALSLSSTGVLDAYTTDNTIEFKGATLQNIPNAQGYRNVLFSGAGLKRLASELAVTGNFTNNGTVDALTNSSTVILNGTIAQTIGGSTSTTFKNLTVNNAVGVVSTVNLTVDGVLNLASANASTTQGTLSASTSYLLSMGANATTTGNGDFTGIVKRQHTFLSDVQYTFGHQKTSIAFTNVASNVKPAWVSCQIAIGTNPGWRGTAVRRTYSFAQDGTGTDRTIVKLHYLDSEVNIPESDESKLVFWDAYTGPAFTNVLPRGKSNNNLSENWVELTGMAINFIATSTSLDVKQWGLSYSDVTVIKWTGNGSASYSGDWSLPGNWNGGVPRATDVVVIPATLPSDTHGYPTRNTLWSTVPALAKTIEIENGATLSSDSYDITVSGATGAWINNGTFNPGSGTVVFNNTGVATPENAATFSGTTNFNNLTINSGASLIMQDGSYMGIAGALSNSGVLRTVIGGATTVEYNGASQTIAVPNASTNRYYNLILSGSGTKTLPGSNLSILRNFTVTGTAVVVLPAFTLNVGGNLTINSGTTFSAHASNILNLNGTIAQTIGGTATPTFSTLTVTNTAATVTAAIPVTCSVNFSNSGTLDLTTSVLAVTGTVTNTGTIKTAVPAASSVTPIPSGKTWGGTVDYSSSSGSQTAVAGTFTNLTISGSGGAIAAGNITMSGVLTLSASNPSATVGSLVMGANTLEMGLTGTTVGIGDVTGIVKRIGAFTHSKAYTFGHENTSVTFTNASSLRPSEMSCKIVIGSAPSWRGTALKRYYSFAVPDGSTDRTIVRLHYLDTELDASQTDESRLIFWDAFDSSYSSKYPRGKTTNNTVNNWIELTGMAINFFVTSPTLDVKQWGLAYTDVSVITWIGSGSSSYNGDWSLPGNWNGGVPTATDEVNIPVLTIVADIEYPYRNLNPTTVPAVAKKLTIASGATLNVDSYDITITGVDGGEWNNNGTFTPGTGTVNFANENAILTGTTNFNHVKIANNAVLTNSGTMNVAGTLTMEGTGAISAAPTYSAGATLKYDSPLERTAGVEWPSTFAGSGGLVIANTGAITAPGDVTIPVLNINANAKLNIPAANKLTVNGTLTNDGLLTLKSDATGTATLIDNGFAGSGGVCIAQQYLTLGKSESPKYYRYWYFGSPVTGATSDLFNTTSDLTKFQVWSFSEAAQPNPYSLVVNASPIALGQGNGYVLRLATDRTVAFSGTAGTTFGTGDITKSLTKTGSVEHSGFSLIGNPYPSYFNWAGSGVRTGNVGTTIWYRSMFTDGSGMTFDTYNATGPASTNSSGNPNLSSYIPPMQAFWVYTADASGSSVNFTNANRSHQGGSDSKLRSSTMDVIETIRLQVLGATAKDEALIRFYPEAIDTYDAYDSYKMRNNDVKIPELYTFAGTDQVVINGLKPFNRIKVLAIGFRTGVAGTFTLKASEILNFEQGATVVLKDKITLVEQDLIQNPTYTFASDVVDNADRFSIVITKIATGISKVSNLDFDVITNKEGQVNVHLHDVDYKGAIISIQDLNGRQLVRAEATGEITTLQTKLPPGIYLISLKHHAFNGVKKMVINN